MFHKFLCTSMPYSYVMSSQESLDCHKPFGDLPAQASRYTALNAEVTPYTSIIHVDPSRGLSTERPIFARFAAACSRPFNTTSFKMRAALVDVWSTLGDDNKA